MRITYLHQYFNTPAMSGGTRSYELARRLVAKGHEVNMITSWREGGKSEDWIETTEAGIKVHWLPVPYSNSMGYRDRVGAFLRFAWAAARRAAQQSSDIVYATSTPLTIVLPATYAAFRQSVPMIFEVRDLWPDVPVAMGVIKNRLIILAARSLEKFAYRQAVTTVVLTPSMRDFVSGKGVPLHRISVISNGSDPECYGRSKGQPNSGTVLQNGEPQRKRILLYCGSLGPAHGPDYLVALAEELRRQSSNVCLRVVGDGSLRSSLEQRARASGCLDSTISFVGNLPQADVPQAYAGADASIMTMADCEMLYRHSVQNKFFDSLAAGKPVFANYVGWASELADQAGAGCILPMHDVASAARSIAANLDDPLWLDEAGKAARRLIEEHFSFDLLAEKLEHVLTAAVSGLRTDVESQSARNKGSD